MAFGEQAGHGTESRKLGSDRKLHHHAANDYGSLEDARIAKDKIETWLSSMIPGCPMRKPLPASYFAQSLVGQLSYTLADTVMTCVYVKQERNYFHLNQRRSANHP